MSDSEAMSDRERAPDGDLAPEGEAIFDRVLIDTSAWIEAMRKGGDETTRLKVKALLGSGRALLCDFVRLELWNGARGGAEQSWLRKVEKDLEVVPTTEEVWALSRRLARRCRRRGVTVPAPDLLIAACARHHRVALLRLDDHFDEIDRTADY